MPFRILDKSLFVNISSAMSNLLKKNPWRPAKDASWQLYPKNHFHAIETASLCAKDYRTIRACCQASLPPPPTLYLQGKIDFPGRGFFHFPLVFPDGKKAPG
jgi:hypothetical protein